MDIAIMDKIYIKRATMLLEDHCTRLGINFDKFNEFLYNKNAILIGSLALSCFDTKIIPNDMDIFIFRKENNKLTREYKWAFQDCFNDKELVDYQTYPLHNIFTKNGEISTDYRWIFRNKEDDYKIADMILFKISLEEYEKLQNLSLDGFYWNGCEWNIPVISVTKFFEYKICEIKQICSIDILLIYEPWLFAENISDINRVIMNNVLYYLDELIKLSPEKFGYLFDDNDILENLNNFFGEKSLMCIDVYLLIKTYCRIYKYINRGYRFPNFELCIKQTYDLLPSYEDYVKQITETKTIKLLSGHTLKFSEKIHLDKKYLPSWEQELHIDPNIIFDENDGW